MPQKDYEAISHAKRLQRGGNIPREWTFDPKIHQGIDLLDVPITCGLLTDAEIDITSKFDATSLLKGLKAGIWSVEQVTTAFCKRAAIAQQLVNCLTEIFFNEAIERARRLDKQRYACTDVKALPPLFGLPVSLKDIFAVKGHDTSTGLACYVNEPAEEHSAIAAMLLDLGAILYCKTNVPQSVMTGDSHNNVFGRTLNPRNVSFTAGGSTGGEGALLALRGSVLGVGTDIAGSIRVPSVCNGTYGMRPSVGLAPHNGTRELTVPGTDGIRSTVGPMATTLRDCALFLKTIMKAGTWRYDTSVISLPWRDAKPKMRLRIGLVEDDGVYTPVPPVRRVMKKAAALLRTSENVEIVPLALPNVKTYYADLLSYFTLSGSEHYLEQFGRTGEPVVPSLAALGLLSKPAATLKSFFDLNVRRAEAARTYLRLFLDNSLDAILMPAAPHTALPWDTWTNATYTALWNYLDYPAVVIPMDVVTDSDSMDDPNNAKYGPSDMELYRQYTGPEHYKGLPIAVQVIGYRHQDEELIAAAEILDSIINGKS
ncbi:amidase [Trichoderma citrinoviride]|uniref:Amidase n=1 Tax=Trichoderma citrinoviride TaxID=58853 RepID=A0A2T4AYF7_9HYPO|nr:amidase [Trichoderma citrinoviride]PTB62106.1 amidase [Trichoderma citrinoviride]